MSGLRWHRGYRRGGQIFWADSVALRPRYSLWEISIYERRYALNAIALKDGRRRFIAHIWEFPTLRSAKACAQLIEDAEL